MSPVCVPFSFSYYKVTCVLHGAVQYSLESAPANAHASLQIQAIATRTYHIPLLGVLPCSNLAYLLFFPQQLALTFTVFMDLNSDMHIRLPSLSNTLGDSAVTDKLPRPIKIRPVEGRCFVQHCLMQPVLLYFSVRISIPEICYFW